MLMLTEQECTHASCPDFQSYIYVFVLVQVLSLEAGMRSLIREIIIRKQHKLLKKERALIC